MISVLKYLRKQSNNPLLAVEPNSKFVYKSGSDVMATWKKLGWIPPTEYRTDYEFGKRKAS